MFFTPKWKKEAKLLYKGALKFLHYKRDLLKPDRIDEIQSRRADLLEAIKAGSQEKAQEASKQLRATCEGALPHFPQQSAWEENVEVIFVALVVALGLRAYVIQPFRIPTGSMQPTLNGITIHQNDDPQAKKPWLGRQAWDLVMRGRTYRHIIAENDMQLAAPPVDKSWFLFTRTKVKFTNGQELSFPAAVNETYNLLTEPVSPGSEHRVPKLFKKGDPILNGWVDTGDLVLVDKISYHFRKPKRGEVFVFDTRGIHTNRRDPNDRLSDQTGGTHYIKRLCGVPGDTLEVQSPNLWINGTIAQEPGIQRVIQAQGEYGKDNPNGYVLADPGATGYLLPLQRPGSKLTLAAEAKPGMREYAAFGDNTGNSADSRYWGSVKEFNLAGPALFSLWPITTGHWGFIR
ncbi:signal peptidase I [Luteolibacter flavescens]|uniref:Signal peptidase I n=1 Tax=Luteolibacter flavescens TaxID=1859460 RepID=A0ABT3FNS5_9BACT|nr:signal peptidase I [Luteolibacter flavescens]MCW1885222.1 signal peptidase I [Luteolibacter flavescens]